MKESIEKLYDDEKRREIETPREKHVPFERAGPYHSLVKECAASKEDDEIPPIIEPIRLNEPLSISKDMKKAGFVFKDPKNNPDILDEKTEIGKKYKLAKEICKDEKKPNKKPKGKSKKNNPKLHSSAMEAI